MLKAFNCTHGNATYTRDDDINRTVGWNIIQVYSKVDTLKDKLHTSEILQQNIALLLFSPQQWVIESVE